MGTYTCKSCGYTTETKVDAKFCQQCGASIVEGISRPVPPPAEPAPQGNISSGPRNVVGPLIKDNLLAQIRLGGGLMNGRLEVRRDGVIYVTSSRYGNKLIQAPLEDIVQVNSEGGGLISAGKITIHLKNGNTILLVLANPQKWASMIKQQMG